MFADTEKMMLQVWYGVLFAPGGEASAAQPELPSWAEYLLDTGTGVDLAEHGRLTWVGVIGRHKLHYGLAAMDSVQSSVGPGRVNTCLPEGKADEWSASIARALVFLGCGTADITWYQTVTA